MTQVIKELPEELVRALTSLGGRRLVLVEGQTDRDIFYHWYMERGADISFFAAGSSIRVGELLQQARTLYPELAAYGIRDRDFLDQSAVDAPLTDPNATLFVLQRYCIENYLLEPAALLPEMEAYLGVACPLKMEQQVQAKLLELCRRLQTIMAANWVLIEHGKERYADGHHLLPRQEFVDDIAAMLSIPLQEADAKIAAKEALLAPAFSTWADAFTRTSGKHLLHQVYEFVTQNQRGLRKDHFLRLLRNRIRDTIGIHPDLRQLVEKRILQDP